MILRGSLLWAGLWMLVTAQNSSSPLFNKGGEGGGEGGDGGEGSSESNIIPQYCGAEQCYYYCQRERPTQTVTVTVTATPSTYCPPTPTPQVSTVTQYVTIINNRTITETSKTTTTTTDLDVTTDYSTKTDCSTKTDYSTTTLTISYPYNVTIRNSYGYPVYTTLWTTRYSTIYVPSPTTTTTTLLEPTTKVTTEYQPTITTAVEYSTIRRNDTVLVPTTTTTSTTEYITSTYTTTRNYTVIERYPVTVVSLSTIYDTTTRILSSVYNVTTTITISYPVPTTETDFLTVPSPTTETQYIPTPTTVTALSVSTAISTTEVLVTLDPIVITTTISGTPTTITLPGATVTSTRTLLPETITSVVTSTLPGQTVTYTLDGTTSIRTLPGSTTTFTTTITRDLIPLCPAPTNAGPVTPQDTGPDALWGCSPGFICNVPKPQGCALYADPPAPDYLCDAKYCTPAPPFSEVVWPPDKASYYPIPPAGYFNLNPKAFGLDYTIFTKTVIVTYTTILGSRVLTTITTGQYESQASLTHWPPAAATSLAARALKWLSKRDDTIIPSVCYASCNNCYLEAQRVGKSPSICASGSTFSRYRASCDACVEANGDTVKRSQQTYFNPRIMEIVGFCNTPSQDPITQPNPPPASTSTIVQNPVPVTTKSVAVVTEVAPTPSNVVEVSTSTFRSTPPAPTQQATPVGGSSATTTSYQQVPSGSASATTSYLQNNPNAASTSLPSAITLLASVMIALCGALFL